MNSFFCKIIGERRGGGDAPVVIVALVMALLVVIFVAVFLYLLPNWQMKNKLQRELALLEIEHAERKAMTGNLPKYRDELDQLRREEKKLEEAFSEKITQTKLKENLTRVYVDQGFSLQAYHPGAAQAGKDPLWAEAPLDFTVTGPTEKLEKAIHLWRSVIPVHVRLFDVEIRKQETPRRARVIVNLAVHYLRALEPFYPETKADETVASARPFESPNVKMLRARMKKMSQDIRELESALGEVGHLRERGRRLEKIFSQRADFSAQRERDFDQLEGQVRKILPRLDEKDHYKIVLKVKETPIQKSREDDL